MTVEILNNTVNAGDIIIGDEAIKQLRRMFRDKETYERHAKVLWIMRDLIGDRLDELDSNSPDYQNQRPLFDTLNELINCILYADYNNKLQLQRHFL
jgi:hypothetical protein